jgi:hypothetical protein
MQNQKWRITRLCLPFCILDSAFIILHLPKKPPTWNSVGGSPLPRSVAPGGAV